MNNIFNSSKVIAPQGASVKETAEIGKVVGQSKRKHFASKVKSWFEIGLSTIGIVSLIAVDIKLLAGTMGEIIWNQFGESGSAAFIPLALMMIAAFAHRLISKQTEDELKRSWLGRLVKKLCIALVFSIAVLFSVTMLKSLYPVLTLASNTEAVWGQPSDIARGFFETKAAEFVALVSPFAEGIFALISGGVLVITAFLLLILMDWWYSAFKTLIVAHSVHNELMRSNEKLKGFRTKYIPIAATINKEALKTPSDREVEFALYFVSQGLKVLGAQRKTLSDRKLKDRVKNPRWQEIGEETFIDDPAELIKQRKDLVRALNIDSVLSTIKRTYP